MWPRKIVLFCMGDFLVKKISFGDCYCAYTFVVFDCELYYWRDGVYSLQYAECVYICI